MGEAKRRKEQLGSEEYLKGQKEYAYPLLPITKGQSEAILKWTSRGAWVGIGFLAVFWVTLRFIGPSLGWWTLVD